MPQYSVDSDRTAVTAKSTLELVAKLQNTLAEVKTSLTNLLAAGYNTPSAQGKFAPVIEQFFKDFSQINETLTQMAEFIQSVGDVYAKADEQVGSRIGGVLGGGTGGQGGNQTVLQIAEQVIKQAAEKTRK